MATRLLHATLLLLAACGGPPRRSSTTVKNLTCRLEDAGCKDAMARQLTAAVADNQALCEKNDQDACATLALQYYFGAGVEVDQKRALKLATAACDAKVGIACTILGLNQVTHGGTPESGVGFFQKACDYGERGGCGNLGTAYLEGWGIAADENKGKTLLERSCYEGFAEGCVNLGNFYATREPAQDETALPLFAKACELENAQGCNNLSDFHRNGRGTPVDEAKSVAFLTKACDLGKGDSCVFLAAAVFQGELGLTADPTKAIALFQRGCELGEGTGCNNLGQVYLHGAGVTADGGKAKQLLERGCELKEPMSCAILGMMFREGKGIPADPIKAKEFLDRACKLGFEDACNL